MKILFPACFIVSACCSEASTVLVEWLEPLETSNASGFEVLNKDGTSKATINLNILTGIPDFEDFGSSRIDDSHWLTDPGFENSDSNDAFLPLISNRVFPQNGEVEASFSLVTSSRQTNFYLAVGGLNPAAEPVVTVSGLAEGDSVTFLGAAGWNSGFGTRDSAISWDSSNRTLTTSGAGNESEMAFLELELLDAKAITITYQSLASPPTGDNMVMAVGVAIPEPTSTTFLVLAALAALRRRRAFVTRS